MLIIWLKNLKQCGCERVVERNGEKGWGGWSTGRWNWTFSLKRVSENE